MRNASDRLAKLERVARAKREQVALPDLGECDALGWPITPAGWERLNSFTADLIAGNTELLERLQRVYGQSD